MVGIVAVGGYVPYYRLSRVEIGRAWHREGASGEKAVANFDEDSLTMAVAAGYDCMGGIDSAIVDRLYFASTTSPYREKQSAVIVARALSLGQGVFTLDVGNSLRCGTSATRLALDAVESRAAKNVLVCASDVRLGLPNGAKEIDFGDGAAALLIGNKDLIASIDHVFSTSDEFMDAWRTKEDNFVRSSEDRFARDAGYTRVVVDTVSQALNKFGLVSKDFAKVVFYSPNPGAAAGIARSLGFDAKTQVQDSLYNSIGNTGSALSPMLLVAALEDSKPGDRILWVGYGDGCDVFVLTATDLIKGAVVPGIKKYLNSRANIPSYQMYLRWRDVVPTEPAARPPLEVPSVMALWRDSARGLGLIGAKCTKCGTPQYPAQRVCISCKTKDQFEKYRFYDKKARIFTFSHDSLAASVNPPTTVAVVDFEGGGRIICDATDRDPEEIKVDMPIEMTFRELRFAGGIHDYGWKCRPAR